MNKEVLIELPYDISRHGVTCIYYVDGTFADNDPDRSQIVRGNWKVEGNLMFWIDALNPDRDGWHEDPAHGLRIATALNNYIAENILLGDNDE